MKANDNVKSIAPLTPMQEGILYHYLENEDSNSYHIQTLVNVNKEIELEHIRVVLDLLSWKHNVLKTSFVIPKATGKAWQVILNDRQIELSYESQQDIHLKDIKNIEKEMKEKDLSRGFDLQNDSLMRLAVVPFSEANHLLLFSFHHIIIDGWSINILFNDFFTYLELIEKGHSVATLKDQLEKEHDHQADYHDYLTWIKAKDKEKGLAYWEQLLLEYEVPAEIKLTSGVALTNEQVDTVEMMIEKELTSALDHYAVSHQLTMNTIMEVAWGILLQKFNHTNDVVFGKVVSGRQANIDGIEALVGLFINTVPVRISNQETTTMIELLKNVQNQAVESMNYDYCSLVEIQNRTQLKSSLIQTLFVFENYYIKEMPNNEEKKFQIGDTREQTNYDVNLVVYRHEETLKLNITYNPSKYEKSEIQNILDKLAVILREISSHPEKRIQEIEAIIESEKELILESFNDTFVEYPRDATVVQLFEEQVERTPENVAVVFEDEQLTYRELNSRANQLANQLRELGVKSDDYVAIMTQRSIEMIIGIYGIIKAGGAYVPIDPTYPEDRIQYMLEDCNPKAVLTYQANIKTSIPVIDLEEIEAWEGKNENLVHINKPNDLIYLIYTSGTTGKPKGVMIEHRNVLNLTNWKKEDRVSIVLQNFNYIFDGSVEEIFPTLLSGCTLEIIPEEARYDSKKLLEMIHGKQITLTPSMLQALMDYAIENNLTEALHTFEKLYLAGESIPYNLLSKCKQLPGGVIKKLFNAYGPTEATVCVAAHRFSENDDRILIGRPISNTYVYMMNGDVLCGIGIPGELYIAGDGVARGYLNRPELTTEKFIDNPYGEGKLYRTGDLAKWLPDGNIEYLGRIDEQVKIRGFRIELGEIEGAIREIEEVKDCAVIAREDTSGEQAIHAYVVLGDELSMGMIRDNLAKRLPDYMIPAYLMQIESIPLTRNGKLDKKALPEIEAKTEVDYVAPRTEIEQTLCELFRKVLNVERIGIKDNFFELGGDSIKAIRIVSRVREAGYIVSVKDIMQGKMIEQIVLSVKTEMDETSYEQGEVNGIVEKTPIIKAFESWEFVKPHHFNQAMMFSVGTATGHEVKEVLTALTIHHDMLRAVYQDQTLEILDGKTSQLYDFHEFDFRELSDARDDVEEACTEIQRSIDLEKGPLVKAALFQVREGNFLMLCLHHLVVDGVSWRILGDDLETALSQVKAKKAIKLPKKTASFQEWSMLLNEYGKILSRKESDYWCEIKAKLETGKIEGSFGDDQTSNEDRIIAINVLFSEETTERLQKQANVAFGTKIDELLLSGLSMALGNLVGKSHMGMMLEGHGREELHQDIQVDRTVGWFTSVYPVVLEHDEDIRRSVIRTKETMRHVPNRGLGYSYVGNEQNTEPDIYFNYLGEFSGNEGEVHYSTGEASARENGLIGAINFNGSITNGVLSFSILCDGERFGKVFTERLAEEFKTCVNQVTAYCVEAEGEKTAGDYGLMDMSMLEFEKLVKRIPGEAEKIYGLTPLQEGMLFHHLEDSESTSYVIQHSYDVRGEVDDQILKQALRLLALRYEVLRTGIIYREITNPKQVIIKAREIELNVIEIEEESNMKYEEMIAEDLSRGFDLEEDPLLRVTNVKLEESHYKMLWTSHHIILDGWCMDLIMTKFAGYYEQLVSGIDVESIEKEILIEKANSGEYSDYIAWIERKEKAASIKYWEELLEGYEGISEINPMLSPEPSEAQMHQIEKALTKELSDTLLRVAKETQVTISTLIEVALGILLQRYNNMNDVVFGKVVSGRNADIQGIDEIVGLFINTIPVRVQLNVEKKIRDLLRKQQKQGIESSSHDFCSLSDIQSETIQKSDLIKVLFIFENYMSGKESGHSPHSETGSIQMMLERAREQTNYALTISAYVDEVLNVNIMYNPNEYQAREVEFILARFEKIFEEMSKIG